MNYYTNEMITVPLDPQLEPSEKCKRNTFERYNKLKRTSDALDSLLAGDEIGDRTSGIYFSCARHRPCRGRSRSDQKRNWWNSDISNENMTAGKRSG